jgi:hypothetical protein
MWGAGASTTAHRGAQNPHRDEKADNKQLIFELKPVKMRCITSMQVFPAFALADPVFA